MTMSDATEDEVEGRGPVSAQEREALVRLVWDDETTYAEAADLADKIIAAGWRPVPTASRSEAEIKAEALREAAEALRLAKEPGHWNLRDPFDADVAYSPDVWLERRAARVAGATDTEGSK